MDDIERKQRASAATRKWYAKNSERAKAWGRAYYHAHKKELNTRRVEYAKRKAAEIREQKKAYRAAHQSEIIAARQAYKLTPQYKSLRKKQSKAQSGRIKDEIVAGYGGKCECCGETLQEFLTVDHINGDGKRDRAFLGSGLRFYRAIKKKGFPRECYRLLCMNCNWCIGLRGYCPHQQSSGATFAIGVAA